jgi:dTMP kinase
VLLNPGPGHLIAVEGLDGSGTTTQVRLLRERLERSLDRSCPVHVTYEPSEGPIGLQIRLVLQHRVKMDPAALAALFAADRMDHLYHREGGIAGWLERGTHVISDRYYLSSLAYQGMTMDWDWLWDMHERCIRPDVTLFVDVPVDICLERIALGRGEHFDLFENRKALTRVRQSYLHAIDRLHQAGEQIEVIGGDAPPDQVHAATWQKVQALF